jgi:hypothetical protein
MPLGQHRRPAGRVDPARPEIRALRSCTDCFFGRAVSIWDCFASQTNWRLSSVASTRQSTLATTLVPHGDAWHGSLGVGSNHNARARRQLTKISLVP